jgi:hypothetical protein
MRYVVEFEMRTGNEDPGWAEVKTLVASVLHEYFSRAPGKVHGRSWRFRNLVVRKKGDAFPRRTPAPAVCPNCGDGSGWSWWDTVNLQTGQWGVWVACADCNDDEQKPPPPTGSRS